MEKKDILKEYLRETKGEDRFQIVYKGNRMNGLFSKTEDEIINDNKWYFINIVDTNPKMTPELLDGKLISEIVFWESLGK